MNDLLADIKSQEDVVVDQLAAVAVSPPVAATRPAATSDVPATPDSGSTGPEKRRSRFGFLRKKKDGAQVHSSSSAASLSAADPADPAPEHEEEEEEEEEEESSGPPAMSNQQFMLEVSRVKKLLDSIHEKRGEVELLHERTKSMTKTAEIQAAQGRSEREMTLIKKYAKEAKDTVQHLHEEDARAEVDLSSGTDRMRHTVTAGLATRLKRELDAFREFEVRVTEEYREVVERRLRVVTGQDIQEEQVDRMITSGEAETVFRKAMQAQQSTTAVTDVMNQTEERYNGMKKLNEDLANLAQMMLDFATLVQEQGQLVDNIEAQVGDAADYIREGTDHLLHAKGHKKTKEKYKAAATGVAAGAAAATAATAAVATGAIAAPLAL